MSNRTFVLTEVERITHCAVGPGEDGNFKLRLGTPGRHFEFTCTSKDLKRLRQIIKHFKKERKRILKKTDDQSAVPGIGWDCEYEKEESSK